ncbi:hypothetical protein BC567DRAFT_93366 [Phyllosticta citribraziliensis]
MPGEDLLDIGLDGLNTFVNSKYYDRAYDSFPAAKRRLSRLRHRRRSRGQADQQEVVIDKDGPAPREAEFDSHGRNSQWDQDRGGTSPPPPARSQRARSSVYEQERFRDHSPRSMRDYRRDYDEASLRGPREPSTVYHEDRPREQPNYRVEAERYDDDFSRPRRLRRPPPQDYHYRGRSRERPRDRSYDLDLSDRQLLSREIITEEYWPPTTQQRARARSDYARTEAPDRTRALSASGLQQNREPFSNRYYQDDTDSEDETARNRKDFTRAYVETAAFNNVEAAAARARSGRISPATTSDAAPAHSAFRRARSRSTRRPTFVEPLPSPPRSPIPGARPVSDYMPAPHPRAAAAAAAMSQSRAMILRGEGEGELDGESSTVAVSRRAGADEVGYRSGPRSFSHSHHSIDRAEWDRERDRDIDRVRRGSVRSVQSSTYPTARRRGEQQRERDRELLRPPATANTPPPPRIGGRSSSRPPAGGIASTALGALAGGFVGTELSKGNTLATVAAAVVGAVGAHEAERKYERRKESKGRREDAGAYAALGSERERDEWDWQRRRSSR